MGDTSLVSERRGWPNAWLGNCPGWWPGAWPNWPAGGLMGWRTTELEEIGVRVCTSLVKWPDA